MSAAESLHGRGLHSRVDGTRVSKHRLAQIDTRTGRVVQEFNATATPPLMRKARRTAARKRARASRKANR